MKVTIIGAGNMGGALAEGLVRAGKNPRDITVTAAHASSLEKFASQGLTCTTDNVAAVKGADAIFIAVKPWIAPSVIDEISPAISAGQIVVSVCPGVKPEAFEGKLSEGTGLVYVIPNIAVAICEGMTFILPVKASDDEIRAIEDLLEGTGRNITVPFEQLLPVTALASCGIAYALRYISASARGGAEMGLDPAVATEIVAQTVKGAAALIESGRTDPEAEIDKVTTPGGLTIRGLEAMEAAGFSESVIKGLKAGR